MNTKALVSAVIAAVCLASGTTASAQSYNDRSDNNRYEQRNDDRGDRDNRYSRADRNDRDHDRGDRYVRNERHDRYSSHDNRRHDRYDGRRDNRYDNNRVVVRTYNSGYSNGYDNSYSNGNRYEMRRGAYLPQQYRGDRYVVSDWQQRRLYAPPRGQHWVSTGNGNDYALVAIATGLIAAVLLNN